MLSKGAIWGSAGVFALGMIVFLLPWISPSGEQSRRAKFDLTMEYELPAGSNLDHYKWGYQGHDEKGEAEYTFHTVRTEDNKVFLSGEMQMSDSPSQRFACFSIQGRMQKFEVPVAGDVKQAVDWSNWVAGDGVRFRWRIH